MNETNYIEFKKKRELGSILSDTFAFLRNQFKPFFSIFFRIVGPYLLVMLLSYGFYMYTVGDFVNFNIERSDSVANTFLILLVAVLLIFSVIAVYVISQATTLFYIRSYANNKGKADYAEIRKEVYQSFWNFIGLGILVGLSVGIGFMFCFIPGIYLYVPLMLSFSVMVFNQKGVTDAYSYSFTLVKDHWWMTFASLFVVGIIVTVASYAFALPSTLYTWMKMGIISGEVDPVSLDGNFFDPISILLGMLSTLAQFLLNIISVVAGVLIYFDLNEKKNFTGTYERIQNLGESAEN
ncbi:hypothetical protein [Poritiphilus flavus]|uniref:Membrane domain of glycerophosphoryl diester phosphodiesterase n=1 Tax=Poritiphilus flavus TaxID=2697053 RepID=A0A6L9EBF1_9FLAO|nr:hypothetical protein [Poritiphilus flavus]NAS12040.1 hypothetical protein [Poritiphilus flavus]